MNFCIKCGNKLEYDDKFCQNCGNPVVSDPKIEKPITTNHQSVQKTESQNYKHIGQPQIQQTYQQPKQKSGSGKIFIIIGILVFLFFIVIIGGVASYYYFIKKPDITTETTKKSPDKEITKETTKDISKDKQNTLKEEIPEEEKIVERNTTDKQEETSNKYEKPSKTDCGYYPYLSTRKISPDELDGVPWEELRLMRNEIFMRHGYIFKSPDLKKHFSQFSCYDPRYDDVNNMLTDIEKHNIEVIKRNERR